jgi:dienelactone hydrolase
MPETPPPQPAWVTIPGDLPIPAFLALPAVTPAPAVIVFQEIFGVNAHIRDVTQRLAAAGYVAIAPAIFQRQVKDFELGYGPEEVILGRHYKALTTLTCDSSPAWRGELAALVFASVGMLPIGWRPCLKLPLPLRSMGQG